MSSAMANWQYPNKYARDSWAGDDGMRFVVSARGGAAMGRADIKNEIGGLTGFYMVNTSNRDVVPQVWWETQSSSVQAMYDAQAYGRLGDLPATNNYRDISVAVGVSAGFTVPESPQWRIEFGFDHIAESDYNENPLFEGVLPLSLPGYFVEAQSGGVQSSLASDIYSVMAFYDFFDGLNKPLRQMIPYVGFGAGYADTKTVLQLTDSYGDLSDVYELQNFGVVDDSGVIQFNKSEVHNSNLAPVVALGLSYGISDKMFIDAGLRAMYISNVKWQLTSADDSQKRDWFSAEKLIYVNAMLGLRVEF